MSDQPDQPVVTRLPPRTCEDCRFWKKDYGTFCFNGWTGMGRDDGHCLVEPVIVRRQGTELSCRYGEPR